jgi:transposase
VIPHGVEIFVALEPIDMRLGFDRLAGLVEERVGRSARSQAMFLFFGKRRTGLKILFFDGTGLCLFYKRLDRGVFRIPEPRGDAGVVEIDERLLGALLDGVEVDANARPTRRTPKMPRTH